MIPESVLVTGGSGGIGWALCQTLARRGCRVVSVDRVVPPQPDIVEFYEADMASETELAAVLRDACGKHAFGGLVNNVATLRAASIGDTTLDDFDSQMLVNARAALQCAQAVLPAMRTARQGRIVNISSRAALGKEMRTAYAATKGALNAMTRTWALELGADGITVNAVAPGPIATAAFGTANPAQQALTHRIVAGVPVKRLGTADDIVHAVEFFLDSRASFVTGQVLHVCGGITVGLSA